jgi:periplasmic divalent cation tolerance protein
VERRVKPSVFYMKVSAPMKVLVVFSTCPPESASTIAEHLVKERLAACVNVVEKVASYYVWEGKMIRDAESLLVIKTASDRLGALTEAILRVHPYEVPEVVATEVTGGSERYLDWVQAATRPGPA